MSHPRPFRFAAVTAGAANARRWRRLCRQVQDLGYSSLLMSDHVGNPLSPLPALAMAAQVARELRVGTLVLCNDFRHPAMAAKELATLDVLSDGRLEWGLGAGWVPADYETTGIAMDPPSVRVDRLVETVEATKALFAGETVTFEGSQVQLTGLAGTPRSVQRPHPPLLIGGAQPRLLRLAARHADIVGLAPSFTTMSMFGQPPREHVADAMDRQVDLVRSAAGERYQSLELNVVLSPVTVTDDRRGESERLAQAKAVPVDHILESPHVLLGTVEEMCEQLEARRTRWDMSYFALPAAAVEAFAPVVERLSGR